MNRQATADELDRQVEMLLWARDSAGPMSDPLLKIGAELRMLPNPEFRSRLKGQLAEDWIANRSNAGIRNPQPSKGAKGWTTSVVVEQRERFGGAQPLAGIALLTGKRSGLFPADHRSFLVSFASHAALIALIASGIFVVRNTSLKPASLTSELTYPLAGHGGGGSGDHSAVQLSKGTPPKFSDQQLAPPAIVVRNPEPKLPVEAHVLGPPDIKLPQSNHIGDLISSNVVMPSNGTGAGGAAGDGSGPGLGGGTGPGVGPGSNGGYGGGPFRPSPGITAPRAIYDPEPEYSEEARRVKHQGVVVLALVVDPQGQARNIRVARSLGMGLDEKAIEAVKKWRFAPGMKDGAPVAVQVNIEVNFRLY
jgi:TonB family protein